MQYYSEKTKKLYMSENALVEAEKAYDDKNALELKKREERAIRAKEVDEAYQHYQELLKKREIIEKDRNQIVKVIEELDRKKKETLIGTYEKVNLDFGSIFTSSSSGS